MLKLETNNLLQEFMVSKKCQRCGQEKKITRFKTSKKTQDGRSVCCRDCYTNNHLAKVIRTPHQIESQRAKLLGRKYTIEHRLAISKGQKRAVKEGRHHWKVNDIPHKNQARCQLEIKIWREKVLDMKGKKCSMCESTNRLVVHHIKCFHKFPQLRTDVNNGQVMCVSCHTKYHRNNIPNE